LIQYTTAELQHSPEHEGLQTAYSMLPSAHSFYDLRSKLIFFEQRMKFTKERDVPNHQAFAVTIGSVASELGAPVFIRKVPPHLKARTMEVATSIKGVRDIPTRRTTIETTIAGLTTTLALAEACLQVAISMKGF